MTEAYERIVDELEKHRNDGYKVPALRVDEETYSNLKPDRELVTIKDGIDIDWKKYDGMAAGTKLIVDENISEPVPDDVELV